MKRRTWVRAAACAAASGATAAGGRTAPARNGATRLRMATAWPSNAAGAADVVLRFAQRVRELSAGELVLEVLPSDRSGIPAMALIDAVAKGDVDMAHSTAYYWTDRSPGFNFFATVPMGMMAREHYGWLRFGGGLALWQHLARQQGVVALPCGNTGVQMGGWYRKAITGLGSFKGLRVRYPGLGGEVLARMGALPVALPAKELEAALADGRLDAVEWTTPWADMALGLHEWCPYYYYPGMHEPGHTLELLVHPPVWQRLSETHRQILTAAGWLECVEMHAHFDHENARHLTQLQRQKQVQLLRWPNAVMQEFRRLAAEVVREAASRDPLSTRIHDSYMAHLRQQLRWAELSERAYWQARYL